MRRLPGYATDDGAKLAQRALNHAPPPCRRLQIDDDLAAADCLADGRKAAGVAAAAVRDGPAVDDRGPVVFGHAACSHGTAPAPILGGVDDPGLERSAGHVAAACLRRFKAAVGRWYDLRERGLKDRARWLNHWP
jgi:hypothetical protein